MRPFQSDGGGSRGAALEVAKAEVRRRMEIDEDLTLDDAILLNRQRFISYTISGTGAARRRLTRGSTTCSTPRTSSTAVARRIWPQYKTIRGCVVLGAVARSASLEEVALEITAPSGRDLLRAQLARLWALQARVLDGIVVGMVALAQQRRGRRRRALRVCRMMTTRRRPIVAEALHCERERR